MLWPYSYNRCAWVGLRHAVAMLSVSPIIYTTTALCENFIQMRHDIIIENNIECA